MNDFADRVLVSVTTDELDVAGRYGFDIELDLNWEDKQLLSGEQPLSGTLAEYDVVPEQVRSVHVPPGTRTRGDAIGMAATYDNVGPVADFVHGQIEDCPEAFLVMHPDKELSYTDQLPLLATYTELTGREIAVENTKSADHWHTPEDMAFYAWAADEREELDDLYLTVDSAHFPPDDRSDGLVDPAGRAALRDEVADEYRAAAADYEAFLEGRAIEHADIGERYGMDADDPYRPLVRTLALAGDRVRSVHFNDPETNDLPTLTSPAAEPGLYTALDLMEENDIYTVLKPDHDTFDDPHDLWQTVRRTEEAVSTY